VDLAPGTDSDPPFDARADEAARVPDPLAHHLDSAARVADRPARPAGGTPRNFEEGKVRPGDCGDARYDRRPAGAAVGKLEPLVAPPAALEEMQRRRRPVLERQGHGNRLPDGEAVGIDGPQGPGAGRGPGGPARGRVGGGEARPAQEQGAAQKQDAYARAA